MNIISLNDRWVYKGSSTIPPCERYVFWNVIKRVYPIKKEHMKWIKIKLKKMNAEPGNYREIQTKLNKSVVYVQSKSYRMVVSIVTVVLAIIL